MYLEEITELLEKRLSPKDFLLNGEPYGLYYGSFAQEKIVKNIMITMDLSLDAICYAVKNKTNFIISLHSLMENPKKNYNQTLISKLSMLSRWPILIYVLNTSFIAAEGGVSDTILEILSLKTSSMFNLKNDFNENIPIGRICTPLKYPEKKDIIKLTDLIKRIRAATNVKAISYTGDKNAIIKKICVVGIETPNIEYLEKAIELGCDCYISGKIYHDATVFAKDCGLALLEIPQHEIELLALKKLTILVSLEFPCDTILLFESKNPACYDYGD